MLRPSRHWLSGISPRARTRQDVQQIRVGEFRNGFQRLDGRSRCKIASGNVNAKHFAAVWHV